MVNEGCDEEAVATAVLVAESEANERLEREHKQWVLVVSRPEEDMISVGDGDFAEALLVPVDVEERAEVAPEPAGVKELIVVEERMIVEQSAVVCETRSEEVYAVAEEPEVVAEADF